nr:hypothetical protein [Tanacetum cinerariifolium]
ADLFRVYLQRPGADPRVGGRHRCDAEIACADTLECRNKKRGSDWNPSWALARRPDGTCMVKVKRI